MDRIFTHLVPLPMCIKGLTCPQSETGDYIIIINENLCEETRKRVLKHELHHIENAHFSDSIEVSQAELEASY